MYHIVICIHKLKVFATQTVTRSAGINYKK